jgi:hypothetical protein
MVTTPIGIPFHKAAYSARQQKYLQQCQYYSSSQIDDDIEAGR